MIGFFQSGARLLDVVSATTWAEVGVNRALDREAREALGTLDAVFVNIECHFLLAQRGGATGYHKAQSSRELPRECECLIGIGHAEG